jgi:mannose-1-phosphate guanylyltransferase
VILAVNKQTEFFIRQYRLPKCGLTIKYSRDPPRMPLGTAGPIKKAEKLIGNKEPFLVLNGDIFADINYKEMLSNHLENKATATIALYEIEDPSRYGVAELADNNSIKRFIEKPPKGTAPSKLINAGAYVLSPKIFEYIPRGKTVSMEREVFPKLAGDQSLFGKRIDGLWIDIGRPEDYLRANMILLDKLPDTTKQNEKDKFTLLKPVTIGKGVEIGKGATIGPYTILGKNVSVGKNVQIENTVIFQDTRVDDDAIIQGAIIGEGTYIGEAVKIKDGCIIADKARVSRGVSLPRKVFICPGKEVFENILKSKNIC